MMEISVLWCRQIDCCETADEFYGTMGKLTQEMLEENLIDSNELMQVSKHWFNTGGVKLFQLATSNIF